MDKAYYQFIEKSIDVCRLSTAIVKNADYKPCIKVTTDVVIIDAIKELERTRRMLEEIINRQEYANVQSMPT